MFHQPADDREGEWKRRSGWRRRKRERKRDPDGDGERERGREICHPRTPTDDRERERKRESIGIRGILAGSLSVSCQREMPSVGFDRIRQETQTTSPDPAGNPDDLARSGRNCLDFTDPTLSPIVPIPPFRRDLVTRVNHRTQKGKTLLIQNKYKS
jgi:hypothetical protein